MQVSGARGRRHRTNAGGWSRGAGVRTILESLYGEAKRRRYNIASKLGGSRNKRGGNVLRLRACLVAGHNHNLVASRPQEHRLASCSCPGLGRPGFAPRRPLCFKFEVSRLQPSHYIQWGLFFVRHDVRIYFRLHRSVRHRGSWSLVVFHTMKFLLICFGVQSCITRDIGFLAGARASASALFPRFPSGTLSRGSPIARTRQAFRWPRSLEVLVMRRACTQLSTPPSIFEGPTAL